MTAGFRSSAEAIRNSYKPSRYQPIDNNVSQDEQSQSVRNRSDTTRSDPQSTHRVTSDMISFTATVVHAPNEQHSSSSDVWTPQPNDVPHCHRKFSFLRRRRSDNECIRKVLHTESPVRSFGELKIESTHSTCERPNSIQRDSLAKYGYMYSRGSVERPLSDELDCRNSSANRCSRARAWSRVLSGTHEKEEDIAALVTSTPATVWNTFLKTVSSYADKPALCGLEEVIYSTQYTATSEFVDVTYTWAQHGMRVRCIARKLLQLGFCAGEGVVISAQTSPFLQALNLAVVSLGGVVAHIRSTWSSRELRDDIFPAAKATLLVVDSLEENFQNALKSLNDERPPVRAVIILGSRLSMERAVADLRASVTVFKAHDLLTTRTETETTPSLESICTRVTPSKCCLLAFDYDELGRVRAAELSHDNLLFTAAALIRSFGLNYRDRFVGYLPLHHVATQVLEFYVPLIAGFLVVCAPTYKLPLTRVVMEHKPTLFFATPATWALFSQQVYRAKSDLNSLVYRWAKTRATNNSQKLLFAKSKGTKHRSLGYMLAKALVLNNIKKKVGLESCSACYSVLAPLDFELERLFKTVDTPIYQLYGTSETCGFAAINFPHAWEFGSCGRALPGTTIRCDERSQEIVLRGRNVFRGHRYAPRNDNSMDGDKDHDDHDVTTLTSDSDGWFRLWQRGFLTPTGFLKINDPRDFLVLATGDWVPIKPFEFAMMELMPELDRVVLIGEGRTFLSALFFLKTCLVPSRTAPGIKHSQLDDDALKIGHAIGSTARTVGDAIRCQHWAVHFDSVLEEIPQICSISGFRVRKWILMAANFSVESGELDPDTGEVCRRAVDRKYQALFDLLYS